METTTNEAAVVCLKKLGFKLPNIRRALLKLVGEIEPKLADACGVTRATVAAHIRGAATAASGSTGRHQGDIL